MRPAASAGPFVRANSEGDNIKHNAYKNVSLARFGLVALTYSQPSDLLLYPQLQMAGWSEWSHALITNGACGAAILYKSGVLAAEHISVCSHVL